MLCSMVKAPIHFFLEEIQKDLYNGNIEVARDKVDFLCQEWEKFYSSKGMEYDIGNLLIRWQTTQSNSGNK